MKVYRVETSNGYGIYSNSEGLNSTGVRLRRQLLSYHNYQYANERPNGWQDKINVGTTDVFATPSLELLKEWFNFGMFEKFLTNKSINIVEYTIRKDLIKMGKSGLQLVFPVNLSTKSKVLETGEIKSRLGLDK
jgi:hypothetical protein